MVPNRHEVSLARPIDGNLLRVCNLTVSYRLGPAYESTALKQVSFTVNCAEIVGLLGESGCGKSTTALALMQMLPANARISMGSIQLDGCNLLSMKEDRLRRLRGSETSIVYQDSETLNPMMRVGNQVMEVLRAHKPAKTAQMRDEIYSIFAALGLKDCDRIYRAFPHQLSGGQRRRVAIAQALICKPRLVIADEPTSSLDSEATTGILDIFRQLRATHNTAILLISHDPETLRAADRLLVMYAGEIVESGPLNEVFEHPAHPYTRALLQCSTRQAAPPMFGVNRHSLACIPGEPPDPCEVLPGCGFSPRCSNRAEICDSLRPRLFEISGVHSARCLQYEARE